jgi:hypothetical protein
LIEVQQFFDMIQNMPIELLPFLPRLFGHSPMLRNFLGIILAMYYQRMERETLARVLEASIREAQAAQVPQPPKRVVIVTHCVTAMEVSQGLECPVCLCKFSRGEAGVAKLKCSHVFHRDCLGPWFKEHHTCPVCRTDIDEENE